MLLNEPKVLEERKGNLCIYLNFEPLQYSLEWNATGGYTEPRNSSPKCSKHFILLSETSLLAALRKENYKRHQRQTH